VIDFHLENIEVREVWILERLWKT